MNTTPSTPTTPTPPPDTTAPGRVGHLRAITRVPKKITLVWTNPHASDLAGVVVRRGWAACPTSRQGGVPVGGTSVRTSQVDKGPVDGQQYCYSVFAFDASGNSSRATTGSVMTAKAPAPLLPVTDFKAAATADGHVGLSWRNPPLAGIASIVVRRGISPDCPTGPAGGTPVGGAAVRTTQVDAAVKPGISYCYRVFPLNAAGKAAIDNSNVQATAPKPPAAAHPHAAAPSSSSGGWLTSTLMRMVAVAGLLMLLVMAGATVVTRRRTHTSAYIPAREGGPRVALTGVAPVAMVIPALLVLGSCAAIALVLLNL